MAHLFCAAALCLAATDMAQARVPARAADADARAAASLLSDLIRANSANPPGDTTAIAAQLKGIFDRLGVPNETLLAPNGKAAHFIARIKGDGSKRPILLAAHADVVPAEPARWKVDPFSGAEQDGFIWGRGALDNKGSLATYVIALSNLVKNKVPLSRDIIFLAEADEEQGTYHTGWLEQEAWDKIDAEFALNEGGRVVWDAKKAVGEVKISYVDKLTISFRITATGPNGHSARPWPVDVTANGQLIKAMGRLAAFSDPVVITPATRAYFEGLAQTRPGAFAVAVRELLAAGSDAARNDAAKKLIGLDAENALGIEGLLRNTLVVTMMQSGVKRNVIPATAEATMNARLFPGQSVDDFVTRIRAAIDNPNIKLEIVSRSEPFDQAVAYYRGRAAVPPSSLDTELYKALVDSAKQRWPKAVIMPTILTGTTDAVPWREHRIPVYGIGPNPILDEQEAGVHGDDERVAVDALGQGVGYVYDVLVRVAGKK